jgi:sugar lactone lactonase YvrE
MKKNLISINLLVLMFAFILSGCTKEPDVTPADNQSYSSERNPNFPDVIPLPDGFNPEGIVAGNGNTLYVGSLFDGAIYQVDRRTGAGNLIVQAQTGRISVGLDFDDRTDYLFVAGGTDGYAYVYDANTGMEVAAIQLTTMTFPNAMINDVIVTEDAAYFTNSFQAEFYKVSLNIDGAIPSGVTAQTIPLTGDFTLGLGFNANGIVANDDGSRLIIANSVLGKLYLTDPATGMTTEIDLGGALVPNADGLVLRGNKLYVVQNMNNQISVVMLRGDWTSGTIINTITHPDFHIPATATIRGNTIYVVNAKFDIAPPPLLGLGYDPTIPFEIVAVSAN